MNVIPERIIFVSRGVTVLAAEVCASAIVTLDTKCSEVVWRVLATHSIRQFPLHFPSRAAPCAITFQLESTVHFIVQEEKQQVVSRFARARPHDRLPHSVQQWPEFLLRHSIFSAVSSRIRTLWHVTPCRWVDSCPDVSNFIFRGKHSGYSGLDCSTIEDENPAVFSNPYTRCTIRTSHKTWIFKICCSTNIDS